MDAPVSGGRPAAEERRLTTMVGGPQPVGERASRCSRRSPATSSTWARRVQDRPRSCSTTRC
ncbi:NAD(P)-binding domain-containing protein [Streptomyces sp. NPDC002144]|uniref:NAD(P)-binding domain-containing protein n=1 Tax=Streptomyces sp. NPDC006668 TaxID=3156903 RepID=UPI0034073534